jgi:hypothetical protein
LGIYRNGKTEVIRIVAYRIHHNGFVIEADTVDDVRALIAATEKPLLPLMAERRAVQRTTAKPVRGASDGALEGRIVAILTDKGSLRPGELAECAKSDRYSAGLAVKALEARGVVRVVGATMIRRVSLTKAARPKEAVQ